MLLSCSTPRERRGQFVAGSSATLSAYSLSLPRSHFGRGGCGDAAGSLLCMPLDVEVR
jgi:hypothetical protein